MIAAVLVLLIIAGLCVDWALARPRRMPLRVFEVRRSEAGAAVDDAAGDAVATFVDGDDRMHTFEVGARAAGALRPDDRVTAEWWAGRLSGATYGLRLTP